MEDQYEMVVVTGGGGDDGEGRLYDDIQNEVWGKITGRVGEIG